MPLFIVALLLTTIVGVPALDNGLVRTPPMGWLHWERFRCNIDCQKDPDNCVSEKLFMKMADLVASEGYKDAGYEYINIDDCWLAKERDAHGRLQPDPVRFPSGIRALADYIHSKGLKFGIYEDIGTKTCDGFPGSLYYLQLDAQTFADWNLDYLKFDGCYFDAHQYKDGYPPMAFFLNMTGRPIVMSCEYALHQRVAGIQPDYPAQARACNLARNFDDIDDTWDSVKSVIEFYGADVGNFSHLAGPGYFNDPDELVIGNFGLSYDQERVQMAIWSIVAGPLLMSVDLRTIRPASKALLLNRGAIAINQDPLGIQGQRISKKGDIEVWRKPIMPLDSFAFAILNFGIATPSSVTVSFVDIGLNSASGYNVTEVFDNKYIGVFKSSQQLTVSVNPSGVFFAKAIAI
jgi:hypothetical protein